MLKKNIYLEKKYILSKLLQFCKENSNVFARCCLSVKELANFNLYYLDFKARLLEVIFSYFLFKEKTKKRLKEKKKSESNGILLPKLF